MKLKDQSLFRQQCYIDGAWVDADDGSTIEVNDPATNEILGTIPKLGANETRRAIEAANAAWPAWRAKTAKERANIIRRWYELMMENQWIFESPGATLRKRSQRCVHSPLGSRVHLTE